jgi:hypothetical protein
MPIIAITTSSSISVKPFRVLVFTALSPPRDDHDVLAGDSCKLQQSGYASPPSVKGGESRRAKATASLYLLFGTLRQKPSP